MGYYFENQGRCFLNSRFLYAGHYCITLIMSTIKSKVLKLFGHIKRSEVGLSKLCLEGMVEGKEAKEDNKNDGAITSLLGRNWVLLS